MWSDIARAQAGVVTRAQLRDQICADDHVDRMLETGQVVALSTGVFLVRGAPLTHRARIWAASLAVGGVIGFDTGAHLWRMIDSEPADIDVIIDPSRRVACPFGVTVHRVFVPRSAMQRVHGIPVTVRSWTALDRIASLPEPEALRFADRALQRHWITRTDLDRRKAHVGEVTATQMRRCARRDVELDDGRCAARALKPLSW